MSHQELLERASAGRDPASGGRGDGGEGVISAAIAILIVLFLGVAVWGGLKMSMEEHDRPGVPTQEVD